MWRFALITVSISACTAAVGIAVEGEAAAACHVEPVQGVVCTLLSGYCLDGLAEGEGEALCDDGSVYVGELRQGWFHGEGTRTWPDGANYSGAWQHSTWMGQGCWTDPDGNEQRGLWQAGRFYSRKICK